MIGGRPWRSRSCLSNERFVGDASIPLHDFAYHTIAFPVSSEEGRRAQTPNGLVSWAIAYTWFLAVPVDLATDHSVEFMRTAQAS